MESMEQSMWNSPYGILRDLVRIVMNVFKYNLISLLYIYSEKKKKKATHKN